MGCARLPVTQGAPAPRDPLSFQAATSWQAPVAAWPADPWWTAYGDPQLDQLIQEAFRDAPDLAAAAARVARAEAMAQLAGSASQPQVSLNASVTEDRLSYNYLTPPAQTPAGWNDYGRISLDVSWDLDFWGRNRAGLAAARSEAEARRAELAQARLLLAEGIATQYAELGRLGADRETALRVVALCRETASLLAQRCTHGLETRAAVREADARRAMAEDALLALDERVALQRNRLAALVGAGPDRGLALSWPTLLRNRPFGLPAELSANLIGRRPEIVAARLLVAAQASRIQARKAEFYPNVNLSAFLGAQSLGLDQLAKEGSRIGSVGPALSLPIFSGGLLRGQLRGAEAGYAEAVAGYNASLARAFQEVADNAVSQKSLAQRLPKAEESVQAAAEVYRVAQDRYRSGLANQLEVLAAESGLLDRRQVRTDLCAQSLVLDIRLQCALGGGYRATQR
jgi:NodT family efflux transporter outer membrane factor (OMF) lipoprotein